MAIPTFKGIITVVTTPFDQKGAVSFDTLGRHIDFLVANGIHAILPGGSTGEYYAQTLDERKEVLRFVAKHVAGRVPLYAGTNSARPDDTLELGKLAMDLGYGAQMLAAPFYSLPNPDELVAHFRRIAAALPLPIVLYNFPARTGVDMSPAFLEKVADVKTICAIKESSGSFARMLEHVVNFPGLQRICGADDQAVDSFLWGAKSWIAGASNFMPAEHVALYEACVVRKDFNEGLRLMSAMLKMFYLLEQGGKYIQYVKYGVELAGFASGGPRAPLQGLNEAERQQLRGLYEGIKNARLARAAA
jgi:4-hydroxy-tetrahydrodipicolinate synthase